MSNKETKNIIICSDGTGNRGGVGNETNVWRTYNAIDLYNSKRKQISYYDDGVGTENMKYLKMLGGAFGWGMSRNIRHAYAFLCRNYKDGDDIYLFGFSRGAYTVRAFAAFVLYCGVIKNADQIPESTLKWKIWLLSWRYHMRPRRKSLFNVFSRISCSLKAILKHEDVSLKSKVTNKERNKWQKISIKAHRLFEENYTKSLHGHKHSLSENFKTTHIDKTEQKLDVELISTNGIKFIGVWDTVSALALPFNIGLKWFLEKTFFMFSFDDNHLSKDVGKGCHAVSIDDQRAAFHPEMWFPHDNVEQVLFSGVHSNVGGGYPKQGMSYVALDWMTRNAESKSGDGTDGIIFHNGFQADAKEKANANARLYNSRAGLAIYYRYKPRIIENITRMTNRNGEDVYINPVQVHASCVDRIARQTAFYNPGNFILDNDQQDFHVVDTNEYPIKEPALGEVQKRDNRRSTSDSLRKSWSTIRRLEETYLVFVLMTLLVVCGVASAALALGSEGKIDELTIQEIISHAIYPAAFLIFICAVIIKNGSWVKKIICGLALFILWLGLEYFPTHPVTPISWAHYVVWIVDKALTPIELITPDSVKHALQYYYKYQATMVTYITGAFLGLVVVYLGLRGKARKQFFKAWKWLRY